MSLITVSSGAFSMKSAFTNTTRFQKMFNLAHLILGNADNERVFFYVRKNPTDFRASMSHDTLSDILRCKVSLFTHTSCHKWQPPQEILISSRQATSTAVKDKYTTWTHALRLACMCYCLDLSKVPNEEFINNDNITLSVVFTHIFL